MIEIKQEPICLKFSGSVPKHSGSRKGCGGADESRTLREAQRLRT